MTILNLLVEFVHYYEKSRTTVFILFCCEEQTTAQNFATKVAVLWEIAKYSN